MSTGMKVSPSSGLLQFAFKSDLHFFPWLEERTRRASRDLPPSCLRIALAIRDWWDFYPVTERLVHGFGRGVFLVDVSRGPRSHDLDQFCARHTSLPGKVILQDQASVITSLDHTGRGASVRTWRKPITSSPHSQSSTREHIRCTQVCIARTARIASRS